MKKPFPKFKSPQEEIDFFENTDLGEYIEASDLIRFEDFAKRILDEEKQKDKMISLRLPGEFLNKIKKAAKKQNIKYQKLIRLILAKNIGHYL